MLIVSVLLAMIALLLVSSATVVIAAAVVAGDRGGMAPMVSMDAAATMISNGVALSTCCPQGSSAALILVASCLDVAAIGVLRVPMRPGVVPSVLTMVGADAQLKTVDKTDAFG